MKLKLDQLEANLQKLVEDQLAGILPGQKLEDRVIQHLATALRENVVQQKDGLKLLVRFDDLELGQLQGNDK